MKKHSTLKALERRGVRKSKRLMTKPVKPTTRKASNKKHKSELQNTEMTDTEIKMVTKAEIGKKKQKKDGTAKKKIKDDVNMEDMLTVETMLIVDATAVKEELLETPDRSHDENMATEPFNCETEVNDDSNEKFVCFMCRKKYKSQNALSVHYALGHKDYCVLCNIQFSSVQEKEEHLPIHNIFITESGETIYGCETCGKKFTIKKNWLQHRATHDMVALFECDICKRKLKTEATLHYHKKTVHCDAKEKKFKCEYCGKPFWSRSDLKIHIRVHTNDRPYLCHICSKAFKSAAHLLNHQKTIHEERAWLCDVCGEKFKTKRKYLNHGFVSGHIKDAKPVNNKEFPCESCGKVFSRKHDFNVHYRIHTGAKPFTCKECNKSFRCLNHLKQHRVVHTGEKPFKCKYCNNGFSQLANVNCHLKKCKKKPCQVANEMSENLNSLTDNKPEKKKNVKTCNKGTSCRIRGINEETLNNAKRIEMYVCFPQDQTSTIKETLNREESDVLNEVVEETIGVLLTDLHKGNNQNTLNTSDQNKMPEDYQTIFVNQSSNIIGSENGQILFNQSTGNSAIQVEPRPKICYKENAKTNEERKKIEGIGEIILHQSTNSTGVRNEITNVINQVIINRTQVEDESQDIVTTLVQNGSQNIVTTTLSEHYKPETTHDIHINSIPVADGSMQIMGVEQPCGHTYEIVIFDNASADIQHLV